MCSTANLITGRFIESTRAQLFACYADSCLPIGITMSDNERELSQFEDGRFLNVTFASTCSVIYFHADICKHYFIHLFGFPCYFLHLYITTNMCNFHELMMDTEVCEASLQLNLKVGSANIVKRWP